MSPNVNSQIEVNQNNKTKTYKLLDGERETE